MSVDYNPATDVARTEDTRFVKHVYDGLTEVGETAAADELTLVESLSRQVEEAKGKQRTILESATHAYYDCSASCVMSREAPYANE